MYRHSTNTASFFSVLMAALIFSLSLAGVAAAQGNTSLGTGALQNNTTGSFNTAMGVYALFSNTTGVNNTANGVNALVSNTTGEFNTAIGFGADVSAGNLTNATAIGAGAIVNASNKIRLGNRCCHGDRRAGDVYCQFGQDQEGKLSAGGWRSSAGKDSRL